MKAFLPLLEQAFINAAISQRAPFMHKSKFGLALLLLAGFIFAIGIVYGVYTVHTLLLTALDPVMAGIYMTFGLLLSSILIMLAGILILSVRNKRVTKQSRMDENDVKIMMGQIGEALGEELSEPVRQNPKTALLVAGLSGFAAAEKLNEKGKTWL